MNKKLFLLVIWVLTASAAPQDVSLPEPATPEAQVRLGKEYLAQKDYSLAMTWFRKAADQGSAAAQTNVGWLYQNGWGVKQDYAEAAIWYRKAAEKGDAAAQGNLGWLYRKGYGVQTDYVEAMVWFRRSADQNNAQAKANIGWLYEKGLGVKQDYAKAMAWFRKAAEQDNADAQDGIGRLYQNGWGVKQNYAEAAMWYRKAAEKGNAAAQCDLGWLYEKGFGVEQSYAEAVAWYYRAADQGLPQAQFNLGVFYRDGLGDQQDYVEAMSWFRKAADQGEAKAQTNIGRLYERGLGVRRNCAEAATWYRKAADQAYASAQTDLGFLYQTGCGVKQDYAEAISWYRKAADQEDAMAKNNIGWFYQNGLGVHQDYAEAITWYRKAAAQGNTLAQTNLKNLLDDQAHGAPKNDGPTLTTSGKVSPPRIVTAGGIVAPRTTYAPDPEYPKEALKAEAEGEVLLAVTVDQEGKPRDIKVLAPIGDGLDEKAVSTIETWKFEPATKNGEPVAVRLIVKVLFHIGRVSAVGKVESWGSKGMNVRSYLSPVIAESGKCWNKLVEDKTHPPSIKEGQVVVEFAIEMDGRVDGPEIVLSSGDDVLDRDARDCISALKNGAPLPAAFGGEQLTVRMQLLYNLSMSINPLSSRIAAGGKEQFYVEMGGTVSKAADWSVYGAGCSAAACGTISPDGVYIAPELIPDPPYVRVKATLPGANPLATSAVIELMGKR